MNFKDVRSALHIHNIYQWNSVTEQLQQVGVKEQMYRQQCPSIRSPVADENLMKTDNLLESLGHFVSLKLKSKTLAQEQSLTLIPDFNASSDYTLV